MSNRHRSRSKEGSRERRSSTREKSREKSSKASSSSSTKEASRSKHRSEEKSSRPSSSRHREKAREESREPSKSRSHRTERLPPRPSAERRSSSKKKSPPPPPDDEYQYEDDFEDYESDFEEDEDEADSALVASTPSRGEPPKAGERAPVDVEQSPMLQRLLNRKSATTAPLLEVPSPRVSSAKRKIVFDNAKQVDFAAASAVAQRYAKLKDLIGLEKVSFRVDDLPAMRDYDFYMSMFGIGNRMQNFCQTGDDHYSSEVQTETTETFVAWTQHPAADERASGREGFAKIEAEGDPDDIDIEIFKNSHMQNPKLKKFLELAADLIIEALSTETEKAAPVYAKHKAEFAFSAGFNILSLPNIAREAEATYVLKNPAKPNALLATFFVSRAKAVESTVFGRSLLVEFNLKDSEAPDNILLCENKVKCCCYSPDGKSAIFAGLNDGTIVAWDLKEPAVAQSTSVVEWIDQKEPIPLRRPSYDSAFQKETGGSPVVQIATIGDANRGSYQVIHLGETGDITVWTVLEEFADDFDVDLGLRPEARFKLSRSTLIPADNLVASLSPTLSNLIANEMIVYCKAQFLVGTDLGFLVSKNRARSAAVGPRRVLLNDADSSDPSQITSMRISPFYNDLLLIGLSSGSLLIYKISSACVLTSLSPAASSRQAVTAVEWSPVTPSVFYSIHDGDRLLVWDLQSTRNALHICAMKEKLQAKIVRTDAWAEGRLGYLAMALSSGHTHVHCLEPMSREDAKTFDLVDFLKNEEK
ncbi:hypothetical protein QR680_013282 [Steinernema hermaphroditum]|uniref:WD repeat-containing protein 60 n=1 Tax=Steinernema hermaphroditum TaxID=289476 RepID=A0AA39I6I9_9BILA|nr:hypothetical protein QR680_013282 [Steinernema hermaphroditum]